MTARWQRASARSLTFPTPNVSPARTQKLFYPRNCIQSPLLQWHSSPTQVLLIANICAVINAPLLAILIIMIVNRKEMGEFKSSKINNILLSLCCAGLLAVTVYNLCKLLHIV